MIQKLGRQVLDIVQWTNNAVELLLEMCPGHTALERTLSKREEGCIL